MNYWRLIVKYLLLIISISIVLLITWIYIAANSETAEAKFQRIQHGMSREQVIELMGQPDGELQAHGIVTEEWFVGYHVIGVSYGCNPVGETEDVSPVVIGKRLRKMFDAEIEYKRKSSWYYRLFHAFSP
jgi:hypothetical protein